MERIAINAHPSENKISGSKCLVSNVMDTVLEIIWLK